MDQRFKDRVVCLYLGDIHQKFVYSGPLEGCRKRKYVRYPMVPCGYLHVGGLLFGTCNQSSASLLYAGIYVEHDILRRCTVYHGDLVLLRLSDQRPDYCVIDSEDFYRCTVDRLLGKTRNQN